MSWLDNIDGFEWDEGNSTKNWLKHKVTIFECEEVFPNKPLIVEDDESHSNLEKRLHARGQTDLGRKLFISFTLRGTKIRVISARPMDRRERNDYDKEIKKASKI
jgi:uncharacterized protein